MSNLHLAFLVSETSVSFAEVSLSTGNVLKHESLHFALSSERERRKEQLDEFLSSNQILGKDYEAISLAYCTSDQSFFPLAVFNESGAEFLSNAVFHGGIEKEEIDFNRVMEHGIVNVYRIPLWVKSYFVLRFSTITIQNERTMLVRFALAENAFKAKVTLFFASDYFGLVVSEYNNLVFSNSYPYQSPEDVVYYTQFAMNQLNLESTSFQLYHYFLNHNMSSMIEEINAIFSNLNSTPKLIPSGNELMHKILPKCV